MVGTSRLSINIINKTVQVTTATEHQACHFSKEYVLSLQISSSWVETLKRAGGWNVLRRLNGSPLCFENNLRVWRNVVQQRCHVSIDCVIWSSFHLLASMTSSPLLAMHALPEQLHPQMWYTWTLQTKEVDMCWHRLTSGSTEDATISDISDISSAGSNSYWATAGCFRVRHSNCVAVFFVLALAIDQKRLWKMEPLQRFLLQCSETYWIHQIQPTWWLGAIKFNAMLWKAGRETG